MNRRFKVTVLTPTLAGSGESLTPIDYMVWQNEVRVLNQDRIFKLLARNPRLESYLEKLRKGERLEWSLWGGYAQSFASAKIPFASAGLASVWEKARTEDLHIPRFAHGGGRRILPGSALKGALRTAWLAGVISPEKAQELWRDCAAAGLRWKTLAALDTAAGRNSLDGLAFTDARTPADSFRVYQTRVLVLRSAGKSGPSEWKPGQQFAEMARPGAIFEGRGAFPKGLTEPLLLQARRSLANHAEFARVAALKPLLESAERLRAELEGLSGDAALLQIGWGAGLLSKRSPRIYPPRNPACASPPCPESATLSSPASPSPKLAVSPSMAPAAQLFAVG
jgi:CRISPR-associated protein Csm5